ncbi:hypothetical protein F5Y18DRAFT_424988 [Xylariaceae sp. FL1019]|nr:hypothetical protein F5Y18DRAFT_424988 [Xylariaceae sp. FL1019]
MRFTFFLACLSITLVAATPLVDSQDTKKLMVVRDECVCNESSCDGPACCANGFVTRFPSPGMSCINSYFISTC